MSRRRPTPLPLWKLDQARPLWGGQDEDEDVALVEWVHDNLNTLPNTQMQPHRAVVEMRIWGKYTFQEIADELGLAGRGNAHGLYDRAIDWLLNGRIVVVGKGEHAIKIKFNGMREDQEQWLSSR